MELLTAAGALFAYMCVAFIVSLVRKDNGVADIAYGWGFALVAWVTFLLGTQSVLGFVLSAIATVWAARLSIRIYLRNHGKPEDFRYKKWREEWGSTFVLRSFLQVYLLQGLVIFLVSLPVALTNLYAGSVTSEFVALAGAGIFMWLVGFYFEAVGDYQLARFLGKPENKGKVMDQGLWRYTRHPNYFGESLMWWGIAVASSAAILSAHAGLALMSFVSPLLITFLLLKVSGVPMLEARFAGNPEWEAYKSRTSVFIPMFPKKK